MESKIITYSNLNNIYEPDGTPPVVLRDETNLEWLYLRDQINNLKAKNLITENQRFSMLLLVRKELGLTVF